MSETRYTPEQTREMADCVTPDDDGCTTVGRYVADTLCAMLRQAATDAEALAAKDWQDISTAPKDGSYVLIFGRKWDKAEPEIHKASWGDNPYTLSEPRHQAWCIANSMDRDYQIDDDEVEFPTHWMPLPEPPQF